jgi:hypothetical protein
MRVNDPVLLRIRVNPTWSATKPPISLLILTYFPTDWLMKESSSSIDSGRGSGGAGFGAAFGAGGAGVDAESTAGLDEGMVCWTVGTAWGSSMVDVAISSRRAVAASSLRVGSAIGRVDCAERPGVGMA